MTQSTHDEVIAWIDKNLKEWQRTVEFLVTSRDKRAETVVASLLANRDVLEMKPRRKRLVKESNEIVYQHAWVDGQTATLEAIQEAIYNRIREVM